MGISVLGFTLSNYQILMVVHRKDVNQYIAEYITSIFKIATD